jgi:hypothetical protein
MKGIFMNRVGLSLLTSSLLFSALFAEEIKKETPKRTLAGNMNVTYNVLPEDVSTISDMFEKGILYGRLRSNYFYWDWSKEIDGKQKDNYALGVGGSLVFKTGRMNNISATIGLYTTQNPFYHMDKEDVGYAKAGKDTFSRYKVSSDNGWGMSVLGQAYLQYDAFEKTAIRVGRQMFHSVFTKSNDTKMIPNTFDGLTVESRDLENTTIQLAAFNAQKLRDHTTTHDVITYGDSRGESWNNNDDSAVHKGLSYANFKANGDDVHHQLYIGTVENRWADKRLQTVVSYLAVPDVVSNLTFEAHYKIPAGEWTVTPGFRYMKQMDNGGGEVGGASLKGTLASWESGDNKRGYDSPDSLDSSLLAGRVVLKNKSKTTKLLYGYSKIEDKADIVAPWRGFPTGGYTRAMAQYNWTANTVSQMVQATYDFNKADIISGFKSTVRYAIMDFDDDKQDTIADRSILHIDFWKTFEDLPNFETKVRVGIVNSDDGGQYDKTDQSYNEYRLEFNYLF